jgi:L-threonylcarbamoyladenylate synthase
VGRPVAAPSANRSGRVSPTRAGAVLEELGGRIDAVVDSGNCPVGLESTVLDLSHDEPALLRPGGTTLEAIEALIGPLAHDAPGKLTLPHSQAEGVNSGSPVRSPGMLGSHYAPSLPVRLHASELHPDEVLLAFGPPLDGASVMFNLSERGDLTEAAARLFAGLRWLDREAGNAGQTRIAAMPVPEVGLGRAINDRLRRAAAPR